MEHILNKVSRSHLKRSKYLIHRLLQNGTGSGLYSGLFNSFMVVLILLNVFAVMIGTVDSIEIKIKHELGLFEDFSIAIFTLEYILRLWTSNTRRRFRSPIIGRLRYMLTPMAIIDLASILPFYLSTIFPFDLRFLRIMRLFRMFRIFKLGRYSDAYILISRVIIREAEYLSVSLVFVISLLVIASSIMYFIEHDAQPRNFSSIPATMWWAIVTLTTVGYGDVYPITPVGKILSGIIALLGIGLFALPAGILASGFSEELSHRKIKQIVCPHCGKEIKRER